MSCGGGRGSIPTGGTESGTVFGPRRERTSTRTGGLCRRTTRSSRHGRCLRHREDRARGFPRHFSFSLRRPTVWGPPTGTFGPCGRSRSNHLHSCLRADDCPKGREESSFCTGTSTPPSPLLLSPAVRDLWRDRRKGVRGTREGCSWSSARRLGRATRVHTRGPDRREGGDQVGPETGKEGDDGPPTRGHRGLHTCPVSGLGRVPGVPGVPAGTGRGDVGPT